jgi:hypothetical protein
MYGRLLYTYLHTCSAALDGSPGGLGMVFRHRPACVVFWRSRVHNQLLPYLLYHPLTCFLLDSTTILQLQQRGRVGGGGLHVHVYIDHITKTSLLTVNPLYALRNDHSVIRCERERGYHYLAIRCAQGNWGVRYVLRWEKMPSTGSGIFSHGCNMF